MMAPHEVIFFGILLVGITVCILQWIQLQRKSLDAVAPLEQAEKKKLGNFFLSTLHVGKDSHGRFIISSQSTDKDAVCPTLSFDYSIAVFVRDQLHQLINEHERQEHQAKQRASDKGMKAVQ